jgi:hypothetical protein
VGKKIRMTVCLILKGYRLRDVWISRPMSDKFCLWHWMNSFIHLFIQ